MLNTVKIRFSAGRGAYSGFWYLKGGRLFETGHLFFFEKQPSVQNKT